MKKLLTKIFIFTTICCFTMSVSIAQLFNKPNPGYIVMKDGTKKEGFVKIKTTSERDGIIALYFSETVDGKPTTIKTKDLNEFELNNSKYMRMRIKVSLISSADLMCPLLYRGPIVQVAFNPGDISDRNLPHTYEFNQQTDDITVGNYTNSEFHIMNNGKYAKVTALFYAKDMKSLFGDNPEWLKKAEDKDWLKFDNIIENVKYYEETKK